MAFAFIILNQATGYIISHYIIRTTSFPHSFALQAWAVVLGQRLSM